MKLKLKFTKVFTNPAAPLVGRALLFVIAFVVLSGVLGPHIISHGLVGRDGFQIYGGAGKAVLFGLVTLSILVWRQGIAVRLPRWRAWNLLWFVAAALCALAAWFGTNRLIAHTPGIVWPIFTHICLLASVVFAAGGSFGPASLRLLGRTYRRQLIITLGLMVVFYTFLYLVYGLWQVLAAVVLHSVRWLLAGLGLHAAVMPPRTLLFNKFGIEIAQYCSGIESIALFTALYALVGVLDWRRFDRQRYVAAFAPALLVLFACNILRVALLILGGYYVNPHIAFSLFHTYAGMIFFILYSAAFWGVFYKRLLAPTD